MARRRGMVLLEIVLSIALFALSAAVLLGALNSSTQALRRVRDDAIAADLLVTTQSMLQMGLIDLISTSPEPFEEGPEGWSWQVLVDPVDELLDAPPMVRVEIRVINDTTGVMRSLTQLMPDPLAEELL